MNNPVMKPKRISTKDQSIIEKLVLLLKSIFSFHPRQKWFALIVALFVWGFVIGQKQTVMEKDVSLQYRLKNKVEMLDSVKTVKVKLSGPSSVLRKFSDQRSTLLINISDYPVGGLYSVELSKEGLDVPLGVKVLSITPSRVPIVLREKLE